MARHVKYIQEPKSMLTHCLKTTNHWVHFRNRCLNRLYYVSPPGPCHGWAGAGPSRPDGSTATPAVSLVQKDTCDLWILQNPCDPYQVGNWIGYRCGTSGGNPWHRNDIGLFILSRVVIPLSFFLSAPLMFRRKRPTTRQARRFECIRKHKMKHRDQGPGNTVWLLLTLRALNQGDRPHKRSIIQQCVPCC